MVLTLEPAALSRSKGVPLASGPGASALVMERHLLVTVIGCAKLPVIKVSGYRLVPVICGPAFLAR
jgi:hypothetical protein